nr:MAG: terminase small subunit [Pseudomonadota bacterium]
MALTPKQARFVAEYLKDLNATQAAIRAGYSKRSAQEQSSRLLSNDMVRAAVQAAQARQLEAAELDAITTKRVIGWQVRRDIRRLFDERGNLKPIHELTEEEASYIAGIEVVKRNLTAGDASTDTILKVKLEDRGKYVEMAAKHFGLLEDKVTHDGEIVIKWQS